MDTAAQMQERHARMLGRLAELGMTLAEDLHARALAAEEPQDADRLAAGFHRLSRSVRQSLALEARLRREAARADRETEAQARAAACVPRARRRAEAKARLDRLVWTEAEDEVTARYWADGVERLLAEAEVEPDFAERPVADLVDEIAATLRASSPPGEKPAKARIDEVRWVIIDPKEKAAQLAADTS